MAVPQGNVASVLACVGGLSCFSSALLLLLIITLFIYNIYYCYYYYIIILLFLIDFNVVIIRIIVG